MTTTSAAAANVKNFTYQMITFETWEYCSSKSNETVQWLNEFSEDEVINELQTLLNSFKLVNFPVMAAMLMKSERGLDLLDAMITKPEHVLALSYFLHTISAHLDKNSIDMYKDLLEYKCSSIDSTPALQVNELRDTSYSIKVIEAINDTTHKLNARYRNNMSHSTIISWKQRSIFVNQTEDQIIEKLNDLSFNEMLSCINDAMISGISKDMAIAFLGNAVTQGASIAATKIFMCGLENLALCEMDTKCYSSHYEKAITSQYSITAFLSEIIKERYRTSEKHKDRVIFCIDESGSQSSPIDDSTLPIYKDQWSGMILWEFSQIMTDIEIVMTGLPFQMRVDDNLKVLLRTTDVFHFSQLLQDSMNHDDGIYEWKTLKYCRDNFNLTEKDSIIILADSGDGNPDAMARNSKEVKEIPAKIFYLNVEKDHRGSQESYCNPTEVHTMKMARLSSYIMEPVLRVLGINCSAAKNMDRKGLNLRMIY